ncbi:MAG: restriction endonuclease, partial [Ktedonobacteraceae bacterium]
RFTRDYHSWFARCLPILPEDLKVRFRAEFDGTWYSYKIKKFLEAPTQPNMLYLAGDENTKKALSYWTLTYSQNFHPCILSQMQILIEASERQEPALTNDEGSWNTTIRRVFREFIIKANEAETTNAKKLSYEYLAIFLITAIDGLTVIGHDTRGASEEIDLWVENDSTHSFWQKVGHIFIVECKNWSDPIGVQQVRNLSSIMENKNIKFAILMARNGITGDKWHDAVATIRDDFKKSRYVVVLDQTDLEEIASGLHPTKKIREKYRELIMKS